MAGPRASASQKELSFKEKRTMFKDQLWQRIPLDKPKAEAKDKKITLGMILAAAKKKKIEEGLTSQTVLAPPETTPTSQNKLLSNLKDAVSKNFIKRLAHDKVEKKRQMGRHEDKIAV